MCTSQKTDSLEKAEGLHLSGRVFLHSISARTTNFWAQPCRFYDRRDGEDAMHAMDGRMMDGRELRVQLARYGRPDDPPSRRSGRSSRRRRWEQKLHLFLLQ